jgi:hypothetical protein
MTVDAFEIAARICRHVADNGLPLGAVRLQKLVYLVECEFYRWEQRRLTTLEWIFLHYGPWSAALADVAGQRLNLAPEVLPDGRQFHGITYSESEFNRLPERFFDPTLQGVFMRVMESWAARPLDELIDHVYFHTAPMRDAQRGEMLDFGTILPAHAEVAPINPYETLSAARREKLLTIAERWANRKPRARPTAIAIDPALIEAATQMDAEDQLDLVRLDVVISDAALHALREARDGG